MDDGGRRSGFWPGLAGTIPRSLGPGFFPFFFCRFWPKCQWPYHGLTDRVFFTPFLTWDVGDHTMDPVCETGVWSLTSQSEISFSFFKQSDRPWYGHWRFGPKWLRKKMGKNPVCGTAVWLLADWVKSLIEKKWPGLSDSHMASGRLIFWTWK